MYSNSIENCESMTPGDRDKFIQDTIHLSRNDKGKLLIRDEEGMLKDCRYIY